MAIRGVPPGITDPNLRGFLNDVRNALVGVSEKVTKISTSSSGTGGGGTPTPTPGPTPTPTPTPGGTTASVVLSISPIKPLTQQSFTLTATVSGNDPTGTIAFQQDGVTMGVGLAPLSNGVATITSQLPKGTYTFIANYSGDNRNTSAVSNTLTVEVGSVWDGPPPAITSLTTESGIGYIVVKWTIPYVGDLDVMEVWGSTTNNRATATKLGESNGSMFVFVPPDLTKSWYFWGRVRDSEGLFSDYYPNTTTGVKGTALSLETEISNTQLWKDLGTKIGGDEAQYQETKGIVQGPNGLAAQYMVKTDVNGLVSGFGLYNDGNISDFFVRADRFAVGNPATYKGVCSIAGHTTQADCKAAGGTWTWNQTSETNIPFIVYTTPQTITSPDNGGTCSLTQYNTQAACVAAGGTWKPRTLTIEPGVYMKTANIQKAFVGDAEIYGDLKSYSWAASNGPNTFPFNGWRLDKASNLKLYGGSFALYDEWGVPIIEAGKVNNSQIQTLVLTASAEIFVIPKPPATAITPSTITLIATAQGMGDSPPTITWSATLGVYTGSLASGLQLVVDPAAMATNVVTFKATTTYNNKTFSDWITLAKVQEGSDALTMLLTNEASVVPADNSGNVTSYAGASTIAKVYRGATDVSVSEGWVFDMSNWQGCNPPGHSGQNFALDDAHGMTADVATITITATEGSTTLSRLFTVTKARQGSKGADGADGKSLRLSATSIVATTNSDGSYTPDLITFTISASGLTGTPVLQYFNPNFGGWYTYNDSTIRTHYDPGMGYWPTEQSSMRWRAISSADGLSDELTLVRSVNGIRGGVFTTLSGPFDAYSAWAAIVALAKTNPVIGDWVTDSNGLSYACTSAASYPGTWIQTNIRLNGNVIVNGTLIADKLASGTINSALITLDGAYGVIKSSNYTSTTGWMIDGNGNSTFNNGTWRGNVYSSNYDGSTDFPNINPGQNGWCISKYGSAVFNTVIVRGPSNIGNDSMGSAVTLTGQGSYFFGGTGGDTASFSVYGDYSPKTPSGKTATMVITVDVETANTTRKIVLKSYGDGVIANSSTLFDKGQDIMQKGYSGTVCFHFGVSASRITWIVDITNSSSGRAGNPRLTLMEIVS